MEQPIQNKEEIKLEKLEILISHILRWGVIFCALIIFTGWLTNHTQTIMAGLFLLILLPLSRVVAAGILFFLQKDYIYVLFSLYVLVILAVSLILGKSL